MEASDFVVGLDIGTTKIAAIIGRKNEHGKLEILGLGKAESIGVARGVVLYIDQTVQSIKAAIADARNKFKLNFPDKNIDIFIEEVVVGIAGQHIKSLQHRGMITRNSTDEEISQKDVDAIIENMYKLVTPPGEEIIHVIPQNYIVDHHHGLKSPIGMNGVRMEGNFHIITGQAQAIRNIQKCVNKSNLKLIDLNLEPLASADSVLSFDEKEAGVVLVDIGGGTTDVAIFYDGIIHHTAVIPFGGAIITDDIKEGCNIIRAQAELLKVKFGSALANESQENEIVSIPGLRGRPHKEISVKNLAHIVQARMEEILEHVYFEIKNSGLEKKLSAGIVVTGGGAQLKHLPQLIEFITGMDCRIGYPNEHIAKNPAGQEVTSPMYATAVGLVIRGLELMEKQQSGNAITIEQVDTVKKSKRAIDHSEKKRGGFFERIVSEGRKWLEDDIE